MVALIVSKPSSILVLAPVAADYITDLLLEGGVVESVDDGVDDTAQRGNQVRGEKERRYQVLLQLTVIKVKDQIEEKQRQPAQSKAKTNNLEELS